MSFDPLLELCRGLFQCAHVQPTPFQVRHLASRFECALKLGDVSPWPRVFIVRVANHLTFSERLG